MNLSAFERTDATVKRGAVEATVISNARYVDAVNKDTSTVVFGNGAFSNEYVAGPFVGEFMTAATIANEPVRAVIYKDPLLGTGMYAEDNRTERLAAVVDEFANESPVHIASHSWSWPAAISVASAAPQSVASLEGYTPTGHRGEDAARVGIACIAGSVLRELGYIERSLNPTGIAIIGSLAVSAASRIVAPTTVREALRSFDEEVTKELVELREQHGIPSGIVISKSDKFFQPSAEALRILDGAGVKISEIDTMHLGAVTEPKHGRALYGMLRLLQKQ